MSSYREPGGQGVRSYVRNRRSSPQRTVVNTLMVDDQESEYVLIREAVRDMADRVKLDWMSDPEVALTAMAVNDYDVYLVDYALGAVDGVRLIRDAQERGCRGPIIMLTGMDSPDIDLAAMNAGAADFLAKDEITPRLLERAIRYARERARNLELLRSTNRELAAVVRELNELRKLVPLCPRCGKAKLTEGHAEQVLDYFRRNPLAAAGESPCDACVAAGNT